VSRVEAARLAGGQLPQGLFAVWASLAENLLLWSKTHNITGHKTAEAAYLNLFLDSLALVPLVRGDTLLDIGSGAGFPGLVLALAIPELHVTLLETRAKKVSFQQHAVRLLGLGDRVRPVRGRAGQDLAGQVFDTVTVRAVSGLTESLNLARPYLKIGGAALLPRGLRDKKRALELGLQIVNYELPPPGGPRIIATYQQ
jgi:16S rRNA (guanine527-N7)-methyltransferase